MENHHMRNTELAIKAKGVLPGIVWGYLHSGSYTTQENAAGTGLRRFLYLSLIPFLCQQEVTNISMLDPVSAHIQLIHCDNIFGKVITDTCKSSEFPSNHFLVRYFSNGDEIAPAQQLHVDDIFKHKMRYWHKLHKKLRPYLWKTAQQCVKESKPFMRPLVCEWL